MQLSEMRTRLLDYASDPLQAWLSNDRCTRELNDAMHYVANLADAADQGLFATYVDVSLTSLSGDFVDCPFYSGTNNLGISATLTPVRRLLFVERTDSGHQYQLDECDYEDRNSRKAAGERPAVYLRAGFLGLVSPPASINLRVHFVRALPPMSSNSDTPGQSGGSGTANLLPVEYHPLIPLRAAAVTLRSENAGDADAWKALDTESQQALGLTLTRRRGARKGEGNPR